MWLYIVMPAYSRIFLRIVYLDTVSSEEMVAIRGHPFLHDQHVPRRPTCAFRHSGEPVNGHLVIDLPA